MKRGPLAPTKSLGRARTGSRCSPPATDARFPSDATARNLHQDDALEFSTTPARFPRSVTPPSKIAAAITAPGALDLVRFPRPPSELGAGAHGGTIARQVFGLRAQPLPVTYSPPLP